MSQRNGLLVALTVLVLVLVACGPDMVTPTPNVPDDVDAPTTVAEVTEQTPEAGPAPDDEGDTVTPTAAPVEPVDPAELPIAADDWHVLGSPDAQVTIFEYSDFQ